MRGMSVYPAGVVVPIFFDSFKGSDGSSITITGLAVTDIEIYKGVSMTQRASDNGYTLLDTDGIDLDGITGIQGFSIDLGDNSDAGFYAAGSIYHVVVSAITVDGVTVNFIADRFRIVTAEGISGQQKVDVASNAGTAITAAAGIQEVKVASMAANSLAAGVIAAGAITAVSIAADAITAAKIADGAIDAATFAANAITAAVVADGAIDAATFAAGAINAAAIAADAITDAKVAADVTIASVTGAVGSVTGNVGGNVTGSVGSVAAGGINAASFVANAVDANAIATNAVTEINAPVLAILGTPAGASMSVDIAAIRLDTTAILIDTGTTLDGRIPAALVGGRMDSSVGAMAANVLTATAINADAITAAKVADGTIDAATFAAGAIDAAAVAPNAIGASELAADAASEIAAAVRTELTTELARIDAATTTRATPAQVNTEVLDVLNVDTFAEPGQEAPAATNTLVKKIGFIFKAWRNRKTKTSTTTNLFADDAVTVDQKTTDSDDGATATRGEVASGP